MENNNYCFVIQPIKDKKYTKRYDDVYCQAIKNAGLTPYRVDLDPSVKDIIDEIERKIENSTICLADISVDNPNVWYELGYAFAIGKDVVMVCDESRTSFPFDISHKSIIPYKTESPSDFTELSDKITEKINSYKASNNTSKKIIESPLKDQEGLKSYEIALIAFIMGEQITDEQSASVYTLKDLMNKSGFNEMATSIGIRLLQRKQMIETLREQDWNGNEYSVCKITEKGFDFVINNVGLFDLGDNFKETIEDLPF